MEEGSNQVQSNRGALIDLTTDVDSYINTNLLG